MFKNKRVLIIGGAGLIGSHIADQLVQANAEEIIIYDNFLRGHRRNLHWALSNGPVQIIEGDTRDQDQLDKIMPGIDIIFDQAAIRITQCAAEPRLALEIMAQGTFNVVEAAVRHGVNKLIGASSASIYGMAERFPTPESHHPYNNTTLYGTLKTFYEGLLRSYHHDHGLNYVALRYFNVYGPRMDTHGAYTEVMIRWMESIMEGKSPLIFGDGSQTMDFVFVEDVARANLAAARSGVSNQAFNVASGRETSLLELLHLLSKVMDRSIQPEFHPERKVNPVPRRLADVRQAETYLGFKAKVGLEEGLHRLVNWWKTTRSTEEGSDRE